MRLPEFLLALPPVGGTVSAAEQGTAALGAEVQRRNEQLAVSTAEEGLALWEQDYGLPSSGSPADRRSRILAAMNGGGTLTRRQLASLAVTLAGAGAGDVEEDFSLWEATLYALYDGAVPEALPALEEAVGRLRPAHLTVAVCPARGCWDEGLRALASTAASYQELHSEEGEEQ